MTNNPNPGQSLESAVPVVYREGNPTPIRYESNPMGTIRLLTGCCDARADFVAFSTYNAGQCRECGLLVSVDVAVEWHGLDDLRYGGYTTERPQPRKAPRRRAPKQQTHECAADCLCELM